MRGLPSVLEVGVPDLPPADLAGRIEATDFAASRVGSVIRVDLSVQRMVIDYFVIRCASAFSGVSPARLRRVYAMLGEQDVQILRSRVVCLY